MELSFGQKLEIGFIAALLLLSAFFFFRNSRTEPDMTINSWTEQRRVPIDPSAPLSATNSLDPNKSPLVTCFATHDGKLEISEYPSETGIRALVRFLPENRRENFILYHSPEEQIVAIKDPYKKTLTRAAYSAADRRLLGLLNAANLNTDQLQTERELRAAMTDQVTLLNESAKTGTFAPELFDKIIEALDQYRLVEGDPTKDRTKALLAHKVVEIALKYLEKSMDARAEAVHTYIAGMDKILTSEQKTKLGESGKNFAERRTNRRPVPNG